MTLPKHENGRFNIVFKKSTDIVSIPKVSEVSKKRATVRRRVEDSLRDREERQIDALFCV